MGAIVIRKLDKKRDRDVGLRRVRGPTSPGGRFVR